MTRAYDCACDVCARFWPKVDLTLDCWLWTACTTRGYPTFSENGTNVRGHRWAYEHFVGPIPDGLHLDHLCRTPLCVNPDHLEPVTPAENTRRSFEARGAWAEHGTRSKYTKGCRCDPCRTANREWDEEYRRRRGVKEQKPAQHGTKSMYVKGCRCDECCIASREAGREYRRRKAELEIAT